MVTAKEKGEELVSGFSFSNKDEKRMKIDEKIKINVR